MTTLRAQRMRVAAGGFTLLELLVVLGILSILMGLGAGFLSRRGDDFDIATSIVRDQLRAARLSSTSRHLPSEVLVQPGDVDRPARLRARVLQPVGAWHMEPRAALDDDAGLQTSLTGALEPGRFGHARRPDPAGRAPLLSVPTEGRAFFDLRDGFAFRVDLRLEARDAMGVLRLGSGLELDLDRSLVPHARMTQTAGAERSAGSVELHGRVPLQLGRWHTLQLTHDGTRVAMLVDGAEVDAAVSELPVLQTPRDRLVVSSGDQPVLGLVDSVALWAYSADRVQQLPGAARIRVEPAEPIRFDRDGDLVAPVGIRITIGDESRSYRVGPGGVLE